MLDFDLPVIRGNISISDAIAEAVDSQSPGLLYEVSPGELRLVHYYGLLQAAQNQISAPLSSVFSEPVINIETVPYLQIESYLTSHNQRFGFKGLQGTTIALLASVSEDYGNPYVGNPGRRCTRPNKPAHLAPRQWYHYPPINVKPNDPTHCKQCGYPLA